MCGEPNLWFDKHSPTASNLAHECVPGFITNVEDNRVKKPIRVAVTGAAGQIAYSLLFRTASGDMLGIDQPVTISMLDVSEALNAMKGVEMELNDCAFSLLAGLTITDDPRTAFRDADIALLVGARPRKLGAERRDMLAINAEIFTAQGQALNEVANQDVKVLVVGNPANTNCYIAMKSAPALPRRNFTAMMRLDHNRAMSMLAKRLGKPVELIEHVIVWGNILPLCIQTTIMPCLRDRAFVTLSATRSGIKMISFR